MPSRRRAGIVGGQLLDLNLEMAPILSRTQYPLSNTGKRKPPTKPQNLDLSQSYASNPTSPILLSASLYSYPLAPPSARPFPATQLPPMNSVVHIPETRAVLRPATHSALRHPSTSRYQTMRSFLPRTWYPTRALVAGNAQRVWGRCIARFAFSSGCCPVCGCNDRLEKNSSSASSGPSPPRPWRRIMVSVSDI